MPGSNRLALRVEQPCEDFVVQHLTGVGALHHRLEVQLQFTLGQGVVDPAAPVMLRVVRYGLAVAQLHPGPFGVLAGLGQCLIESHQHVTGRFAGAPGDDAQIRDRHAVTGTGQAQVFQGGADFCGQACGVFGVQARRQQAEFAPAITGRQPGASLRESGQALEQFADRTDQRISALTAQALVEPAQVIDP
ncbi:hypothetical protein D3C81_918660 [compost metagenome]